MLALSYRVIYHQFEPLTNPINPLKERIGQE